MSSAPSVSLWYAALGGGMYFWVRRRVGPLAAAVALLFLASLPASPDFALRTTACQVDMVNLLLSALAVLLVLDYLRQPSLRVILFVGAALGAVMAVKLSAFFVVLLAVAAVVVWSAAEETKRIDESRSASRLAALGSLTILLAGSLLVTAVTALLATRGGPGLWRLPIPTSWPRVGIAVYPLTLTVVFAVVYLLGRHAGDRASLRPSRTTAGAERIVLMSCAALIAFAFLCPNGVMALHFVRALSFQSGSVQAGADSWLGVLAGGALLWLLPLSAIFAALLTAECLKVPSELDRVRLTALFLLAWEALALIAAIVLIGRARERWLWPLFPAFVLTADLGVMAISWAVPRGGMQTPGRPAPCSACC